VEARARQAHVVTDRRGEQRGRLGHLHREITASFFIHSRQPPHRPNTFFVVSLRIGSERKITLAPYCLYPCRSILLPSDKGRAVSRRELRPTGGVRRRRIRGGDFFIVHSYRPGLCLYVSLPETEGQKRKGDSLSGLTARS
jgi:hypothetical protein